MSKVTDIILITATDEPAFPFFNQGLYEKLGSLLGRVDMHALGNKVMQCHVYMGAFKNIDHRDVLNLFVGTKWESPDEAQLMLKGEGDDLFTRAIT